MGRIAEAVLHRRQVTIAAALAGLTVLAWAWTVAGAGTGMEAQARFTLFPHHSAGMAMAGPTGWDAARFLVTLSMWWVMMVAMMLPAAAPVVLLYVRASPAEGSAAPHAGAFLSGYLLAWLAFSIAATGLQSALEYAGLLDAMGMTVTRGWLAAAVLVAAGIYQLAPLKDACLAHCRNPGSFLARHYRPGASGALRMGLIHGAYCVGCCWLLMALLFVGGVMNLAWIALLTLVVAAEKLLPGGRRIAQAGGVLFLAWGAAIVLAG